MQVNFSADTQVRTALAAAQPGEKQNFGRKNAFDPEARTVGKIPTLQIPLSAKENTLARLSHAADPERNFETALAYSADNAHHTQTQPEEDDNYDFYDVLDIINPLQHIPLVSTLYRGISGDEIKPAARIIGGTIYGGPVGAVSSTVNVVIEHETGRDLAGNAIAMFAGDTIQQPEIKLDRSRALLAYERTYGASDDRQADATSAPLTKKNFSSGAAAYHKASRYNS